jgi:hypothetical protein
MFNQKWIKHLQGLDAFSESNFYLGKAIDKESYPIDLG